MSFVNNETWSKGGKSHRATPPSTRHSRATIQRSREVRRRAENIVDQADIWNFNDFLTQERRRIDEKYDYRYSFLIFVFARLIREGWLTEDELAGLSEDKLTRFVS